MKSITFFVTKSDSVYTASSVEENIVTQSENLDTLISNIEEAISLYFEPASNVASPYTIVFSGQAQTA